MTPVGYLAKQVLKRPDWLNAGHVADVYSVSGCISPDFADYVKFWKHNGCWFFDSPAKIQELAADQEIDLTGTTLFFYEMYEQQFDEKNSAWTEVPADCFISSGISLPASKVLQGFDVVTYSCGTTPECSPLSCNSLATQVETNAHCLLPSFQRAKQLLKEGLFRNSEPGPFRIFAVYSIPW
jgi:hypothetical protein